MARASDSVDIEGLRELRKALREVDGEMHKRLRLVANEAAGLVVREAQPHVPSRTGKARKSMRAQSTQTAARVKAGGKRVPYYAWLDFGGRVGRDGSIRRPFKKSGRYIFPAYSQNRDKVLDAMVDGLSDLIREAGLTYE